MIRGLTAEGAGLMYSQAHVTAKEDGFDSFHLHVIHSLMPEHGPCDRGNGKGSPGKHGDFLLYVGNWNSSRPRLRSGWCPPILKGQRE